ncbi:MAG TPA: hypothetical protein PLV21_03330 [Cyclobacteriaceae bacterium]|nr:hypothetical protein [Cyclobacteriaceae bacterium]HRJ80890.1 hypothetical protein [Cyclobacteriaceae bacterium]
MALKITWYVLAWTFIIVLSVYFFLDNVIAYFYGYRSSLFGNTILNNQLWVVMHMVQEYFWSFVPHILAEIWMVWIPAVYGHKD